MWRCLLMPRIFGLAFDKTGEALGVVCGHVILELKQVGRRAISIAIAITITSRCCLPVDCRPVGRPGLVARGA